MINNLSTGASWVETTDTWQSTRTWASYSDVVNLTNISAAVIEGLWVDYVQPWLLALPWQYQAIITDTPYQLNNLSTGASWVETTDTWQSTRTWASYSDTVTMTNLS
jgi:hypothetical protein